MAFLATIRDFFRPGKRPAPVFALAAAKKLGRLNIS